MSKVISSEASNYDHWAWLYNHTLGPRYSEQKIAPWHGRFFRNCRTALRFSISAAERDILQS